MVSMADPFVCPVCKSVYPHAETACRARETLAQVIETLDVALELATETGRPVTAGAIRDARDLLNRKDAA